MRIRSTKPEFWRSKLIASVSWDARFVLKALESYVDDNGVGEDDVNVLVGDCFLHDLIREPSRTLARVSEAISELHQAGLVWRYASQERNLLYVAFWEDVQRIDKPLKGRNPRPDGTLDYKESKIRECVATSREESRPFAPGTGEQGNRGTEEQSSLVIADAPTDDETETKDLYSPTFLDWWQHYPRKTAKGDAFKAWESLRKSKTMPPLEVLISAAKDLVVIEPRPEFRPHPATWIRSRRWEDEPDGGNTLGWDEV